MAEAQRQDLRRIVGLLDSRVIMGAAAKGRSSSKALSRVLKTSLGYIIGGALSWHTALPFEMESC